MDPGQFFASSRVLVVAGKGGVGKSVTAATIAAAAAHTGRTVLLVEVAGRSATAAMFGADAPGYEDPVRVHEADDGGFVELRSITPDGALKEWLQTHGFAALAGRMAKSGLLEVVATATPGIKDLLVLGRIKALETQRAADLIVVDAPAAGHAIGFLRAPVGVRDAARSGVLHRQAEEAIELLADPTRCQVVLTTIAEETPVNELIDTAFALEEDVGVALAPIVVNGLLPELADLAPVGRARGISADQRGALSAAADFRLARESLQREQLARLDDALPLPRLSLPHVFGTGIGPEELTLLSDELLRSIEELPTP